MYLRVHTHTLLQAWTSEDTLWNSVLACTTGVPGIKLRWSSLAATTFTHRAMPPAAPTTTRFSRQCLREPRLLSYSQVAHGDLKLRIFRLHLPRAGVFTGVCHYILVCGVPGMETTALCMLGRRPTNSATFPAYSTKNSKGLLLSGDQVLMC